MAFVVPEAVVEIPEAEAAASGLLAWLGRKGVLSGAVSLLSLLFGRRPSEPATGNAMRPVVDLLAYPQRAMYVALFYINYALDKTTHKLAQVRNELGQAYNSALRYARLWDAQLGAHLNARIDYVNRRVGDAYNQALRVTSGWVNDLARFTDAQVRRLDNRIGDAYNQALRVTSGWVNDLARFTRDQVARLDKRIGDAYNSALTHARVWDAETRTATTADITHQVTQPTRATYPQLVEQLGAATVAIGGTMPALQSLINAVPTRAPATLGEAAVAPQAVERVLLRAMTDCVIPNCRNLSKAGRDLTGLGELLGAGGFLAFLAYAATHPTEAVRDTEAVAGALVADVTAATRDLMGV